MALKNASREVRLQWFARQVIDATWTGSPDGGEIQDWALAAGLITEHEVTQADVDGHTGALDTIENAEHLDVGDSYYKFSTDLEAESVRWSELSAA